METLSGEGPFTVFAPTDAAFGALPQEVIDALLADPTGDLTDILLYHVLSGQALSSDLMDGMTATTLNGKDITVTINDDGVFINDAQVTVADIQADNGVVHVIDAVLIPPTVTVVDIIVNSEDHNILETVVTAAGLADTLSTEGPFTVFAPTDAAFGALPQEVIDALLADPTGDLTDVLLYHVLSGEVLSTDLMDGMTATTLNGADITVTINDDGIFINDAQVTVADIQADNGVVHVIDAVLMPPVVDGGEIALADGSTEVEICAGDGVADPLDVTLTGAEGTNSAWVITDADGNILALPEGPPFDLEGAGAGVCLIWHLSFEDGLTGAEVGANAADLEGCFSLSNPISVTRNEVNGGEIALADGSTEIEICAGDGVADPLDVTLAGAVGTNSAWVITDADANILALPAGPPFDLEGAGAGVCLIWHLSFEDGLTGAEVGANAADLEGCFSLSNPISVTRNEVKGGEITTSTGGVEQTVCLLDGNPDIVGVMLEGAVGTNSAWVITDADGNILDLPAGPPFDFSGADAGVCLIWHLSFEDGLTGAEVGANAADLEGCFSLSNPITVTRSDSADCETPCEAPADATVTVNSPTSVFIDWADITGAFIYYVFYRPVGTDEWKLAPVYQSRRTINNLTPGTLYEYQIRTICLPDLSPFGPMGQFATPMFAISSPVDMQYQVSGDQPAVASMDIMPNPVVNTLRLSYQLGTDSGRLSITHISGQKVFETRLAAPNDYLEVDLSNVPSGYYLVTLNNGKEIITKKLVKADN